MEYCFTFISTAEARVGILEPEIEVCWLFYVTPTETSPALGEVTQILTCALHLIRRSSDGSLSCQLLPRYGTRRVKRGIKAKGYGISNTFHPKRILSINLKALCKRFLICTVCVQSTEALAVCRELWVSDDRSEM